MKTLTLYLACCEGWYENNIPGEYYYKRWRRESEKYFKYYSDGIYVINPCDYYDYKEKYHKSEQEIRRFDLHKVRNCDVVLVNLDHIKDSVGTLNEIFCADENRIPIIGFYEFNGENNNKWADDRYKTEPWILDACHRIEDEEDALINALTYIENYFFL